MAKNASCPDERRNIFPLPRKNSSASALQEKIHIYNVFPPSIGFRSLRYPELAGRDTELPSPSRASLKDQNALLRQHRKAWVASSIPDCSLEILFFPDPSVWHCVFIYSCLRSINLLGKYSSKCRRAHFCVDVYRLCQQRVCRHQHIAIVSCRNIPARPLFSMYKQLKRN